MGLIVILTILGNCWCILVIRRASDFKKATKIFLLSLTVADLVLGLCVTLPTFVLLWGDRFSPGRCRLVCSIVGKAHLTVNIASILSLMAVNMERYLSVEFPLRAPALITTTRAKMYVAVIYVVSALFLAVYVTFQRSHSAVFDNVWLVCRPFQNSPDDFTIVAFSISVTLFAAIPFLMLIIIYARIYCIIQKLNRRADRQMSFNTSWDRSKTASPCRLRKKNVKALVTFLMITCTFVISWVPIMSFMLHELYTGSQVSPYWEVILYPLLLCNYWWNIVIFIARNRSFRKTALRMVGNCPFVKFGRSYLTVLTSSNAQDEIQQEDETSE